MIGFRKTCPVCGRRKRWGWTKVPFYCGPAFICDGCIELMGLMARVGYEFESVQQFRKEAFKAVSKMANMVSKFGISAAELCRAAGQMARAAETIEDRKDFMS